MAVASLVMGIVALVFTFTGVLGWLGLIAGIVGIIFGALAKKNNPNGMATAGLVCSIIGTAVCGVGFLACAACAGAIGSLGTL